MTGSVNHSWTRGDPGAEAVALDAVDDPLLVLVARLPLSPIGVLVPFLNCGAATAYRWAAELSDRGLLAALTTPQRTSGRPGRLWLPTELGLAVLAQGGATESTTTAGALGRRRATPSRLITELPSLLAVYELLASLAAVGPGLPHLHIWEQPWRRMLPERAGARAAGSRVVRLPAAATLAWDSPDGTLSRQYLLLPDTGGLALPALRGTLGRVAEHQASGAARATLVIATTTPRRAAAWTDLLERVCQARHVPLLAAHVTTWADLREATPAPHQARGRQHALVSMERPLVTAPTASWADTQSAVSGRRRSRGSLASGAVRSGSEASSGHALGPVDRAVLELVGRHAFVATATLAAVLGHDLRWARTRQTRLAQRGLLRILSPEEVTPPDLARWGLLELTGDGLRVLAAHMGLPLGMAVRHHGLAGGGPKAPLGPRAALLAHLPHTLGTDAVFAGLARAARAHPAGGALLEWRSAAACTHGRVRPDGYGLLRLGRQQHGFFLEFDRGSMRPGRLRAKFAAYARYRASSHAARTYAGFPLLLLVTTGPGPEQRLARALRAAEVGQRTPLPALLTTTALLQTAADGPLGRVWRTAANPARRKAWE